jgi:hypothetical protein
MRLGQLARKLALRPTDIVEFLAENNIRIPEGANARVENDHVNLIMKRFVPGWIETSQMESEPDEEVILPGADSEPLNSEQLNTEEQTSPTAEPVLEQELTEDSSEVIRAPKIELSGLNVLGRIDCLSKRRRTIYRKKKEQFLKALHLKKASLEDGRTGGHSM